EYGTEMLFKLCECDKKTYNAAWDAIVEYEKCDAIENAKTSIFYLGSAIVIGIVYAYGVIHEWKNQWLLFFSVLGNLVVTLITVMMMGAVFGYNIEEEIQMFIALVPDGVSFDIKEMVTIVIVLSYLGIALMQAIITHILSIELMRRLKIKTIMMKNAFDLHFPRWTSIAIIASYVLYLLANYLVVDTLVMRVVMLIYCCMLILSLVDGALTIICYLRLTNKGKVMIFLVLLACFMPIIQTIISLIGVFDIWEQLRRKMKEGVRNEIHRTN
ncbi:MAG: DUF2232 domain-containing protein, partial [Erysipelotrichia bacterium]|nr:DUF2232 domain-containing protein [Erysipelotrichia bacterium]